MGEVSAGGCSKLGNISLKGRRMPKSEYSQKLDQILQNLSQDFKNKDYRKRSHTYNRVLDSGIIHVVNFQMGTYPLGPNYVIPGLRPNFYGKFTLNAGIFIPEVFVFEGREPPVFVSEPWCHIRRSTSLLTPEAETHWWDLRNDLCLIAHEIQSYLMEIIFPYLQRFQSYEDIIQEWKNDANFWRSHFRPSQNILMAVVLVSMGKRQIAENLLQQEYKQAKLPRYADFVVASSKKLGFTNIHQPQV
jgi:hypothetical protein